MSLFPGWKKKPPQLTDRQKIEKGLLRHPGASDIPFDTLWELLLQGREDYALKVDPVGRGCEIGDLLITLSKPDGYTEQGQPWMYNIHGEKDVSFFAPDLGMYIYLADPNGLRHEMLHYLDYKLHPSVIARYTESGQPIYRWQIIGHGGEGDPMAIP